MTTRKDVAVSFLRQAASGRVREAYDKHVSTGFRHHNPFFAGDAHGAPAVEGAGVAEAASKGSFIGHMLATYWPHVARSRALNRRATNKLGGSSS